MWRRWSRVDCGSLWRDLWDAMRRVVRHEDWRPSSKTQRDNEHSHAAPFMLLGDHVKPGFQGHGSSCK
jgi:hypothetical protein